MSATAGVITALLGAGRNVACEAIPAVRRCGEEAAGLASNLTLQSLGWASTPTS